MSEYLTAITWYLSWPILIYISYKFVTFNLARYTKIENLQEAQDREKREYE